MSGAASVLVARWAAVLLGTAVLTVAFADSLDVPLVVTQLPVGLRESTDRKAPLALARPAAFEGARLVKVLPGGEVRVLSEGFDSACDPSVSFDGAQVLFAGKRNRGDRWRIWQIGLDGAGLRVVSPEHLDARSPIHVSTLFTLDSPEPWYTTVFVGAEPTLNEAGSPGVFSLYNVKLDGNELRRLTFNPNANLDPFQTWDGRLIYSAERRPNEPGDPAPHVGLYAIHIEGADMEFYGGERGKRIQRTPCATESGVVVFVESDAPTPDGAGQLACVQANRPHVTYRALTTDPALVYRQPAPWKGRQVLVSRRPTGRRANWEIVAIDTETGSATAVFDTPQFHEVQAVAAVPHRRPDGHSTVVETRFDTGLFYGLNCYDADARMASGLRPGMVQRVRFIEGVPAGGPVGSAGASGSHAPGQSVSRRLVGEAPVEADGSFNVEVPIDIPLLVQSLDERGMALATCGWVWVKPREKRGCIGCHEDPERIPENSYVLALQRPSNRLVLPPDQRRSVTFRQDIAPILQANCSSTDCHGNKKNELHLPLTSVSATDADLRKAYERLLAPADRRSKPSVDSIPAGRYVDVGRARTSPLAWHLAGTNTTRPWDSASRQSDPAKPVPLMPPSGHGTPLTPEQLRTFVQWIDMGAPFDVSTAAPQTSAAK